MAGHSGLSVLTEQRDVTLPGAVAVNGINRDGGASQNPRNKPAGAMRLSTFSQERGSAPKMQRQPGEVPRPAWQGPRPAPCPSAGLLGNIILKQICPMTGSRHAAIAKGDFKDVPTQTPMLEIPVFKNASPGRGWLSS